jgi:uncharacterized iron-regulated membrane protein
VWTGLLTGLFIFVICLTGAVAVFRAEIDRALTPAKVVAPGPARASLDDLLAAARREFPGGEVTYINFPAAEHEAYSVWVERAGESHEVFADPYTGRVTGSRTGENFANVLRQLHVRFYYFGWQGRVVVGFFGLTLLVSTLTGLLIYARFIKGMRWWRVRRGRGPQVSSSDWHKLVGILSLAFNLVIAVTGAVLGLENLARYAPEVGKKLHPQPRREVLDNPPATLEGMIPAGEAVARARAALEGFEPTYVEMPVAGSSHFLVYGNDHNRLTNAGASFVVVDTRTGAVLDAHSARRAEPVTRAYNLMEPLHFGDFAGVPVKILYLLFGLTASFLSVTGYVVWALKALKRRRARRRSRAAPPAPARPAWQARAAD